MTTILCLSLAIAMVIAAAIVQAQQPKKISRIGILFMALGINRTYDHLDESAT